LLDSYEPERIAFARRLVATTDRIFTVVTSPGRLARFVRVGVVPRLLPALARSAPFRRFMFRTVSQTALHYRAGPLSEGRAGRVRGGDRLPWVAFPDAPSNGRTDNFAPLAALDWQVHVYGEASPGIAEACGARGLALHVFPWWSAARRSGLRRRAVYLVRPDGYVGFADTDASPPNLERYLDGRRIRPLNTALPPPTIPGRGRLMEEPAASGP
jgi:hypothetical protein